MSQRRLLSSRIKIITLTLLWAFGNLAAFSQKAEPASAPDNIIQRIIESSSGNVEIDIPESILQQILTPPEAPKKKGEKTENLKKGLNKLSGYRIQVFSDGRNQQSLEARAKARGNAVLSKFPKYRGQVYSFSKSPSWFTRVGNFRTEAEANKALAELKRAFPKFAGEMRVVRCEIVIVK